MLDGDGYDIVKCHNNREPIFTSIETYDFIRSLAKNGTQVCRYSEIVLLVLAWSGIDVVPPDC